MMRSSLLALLSIGILCRVVADKGPNPNNDNSGGPGPSSNNKGQNPSDAWVLDRFESFLAFGDSYTDEDRLFFFIDNNGSAPPPGTLLPESFDTFDGGRIWARYVIQYTGKEVHNEFVPQMILYDYAVAGAVCSNEVSPRPGFPGVIDYEVPALIADSKVDNLATGKPYFTPPLTPDNAVFSLWIGTNDLGAGAFLTDSQLPGNVLTDYTDCIFSVLDGLYAFGGRFFVLFNNVPLQLSPLYANDSFGGVGPNHYWTTKPDNHTAISEHINEEVNLVNDIFKFQLPFEANIQNRYPGANFALFDVYSLIMELYNNPTAFFNGSAPANVTGFENHCAIDGSDCVLTDSPDSFLWFDELHPSEQTNRIIARNFVDVISGNSSFATYI